MEREEGERRLKMVLVCRQREDPRVRAHSPINAHTCIANVGLTAALQYQCRGSWLHWNASAKRMQALRPHLSNSAGSKPALGMHLTMRICITWAVDHTVAQGEAAGRTLQKEELLVPGQVGRSHHAPPTRHPRTCHAPASRSRATRKPLTRAARKPLTRHPRARTPPGRGGTARGAMAAVAACAAPAVPVLSRGRRAACLWQLCTDVYILITGKCH